MPKNIEEDLKRKVEVKKVVKVVKKLGSFAMCKQSTDSMLLITSHFILNLNEKQGWAVQCALLVKEFGKWFTIDKGDLIEGKPVTAEQIDIYYRNINNLSEFDLIGFTELFQNNIALYHDSKDFIGIKKDYIDMFGDLPTIKKNSLGSILVISDSHIMTPIRDIGSDYLIKFE